jgi:SAM-dependent methyltransferase
MSTTKESIHQFNITSSFFFTHKTTQISTFEYISIKPHVLQGLKTSKIDMVEQIRHLTGIPALYSASVSRADLKLDDDFIHLDIGGEGYNESIGVFSGFNTSINVNAHDCQSNGYGVPIPNLVKVQSWMTDPSYPFADGFADYITMQNAPLTAKNIDEIARCLRPGGVVELWVDTAFKKDIQLLAKKLNSIADYEVDDEFNGSTGSIKIRIVSAIKPTLREDYEIDELDDDSSDLIKLSQRILSNINISAQTVMSLNSIYNPTLKNQLTTPKSEIVEEGVSTISYG